MKLYKRIISLSLVMVLTMILCAACSLDDFSLPDFPGRSNETPAPREPVIKDDPGPTDSEISKPIDLPADSVPLAQSPAIPIVLMPEATGARVEKNSQAIIDYSNAADGYVMVKWLVATKWQLRVQVTGPSGIVYTYIIHPDESFNVLPLSDGNGSYQVQVYEQNESGRYSLIISLNTNVTLKDEFAPFLRPNQYVNFNETSNVVIKAAELVTANSSLTEKIAAVYTYVIRNFTYDTEFAELVSSGGVSGYIPDLDEVFARRKGICFDYAAVMTAMLRSQGIPTKMVFGYADDIYHAWINVYSEETGWVDQVIFFDGENWIMMDPTFASAAGNSSNLQAFIGDGNIYTVAQLF